MAVTVPNPVPENPKKRRKFASAWDIPPAQFKSCDESPFKGRRKMTSSWDVPPRLLQDIISKHVINYAPDLVDLLYGLLEFDPSKRMTAAEALRHPFFRASKR